MRTTRTTSVRCIKKDGSAGPIDFTVGKIYDVTVYSEQKTYKWWAYSDSGFQVYIHANKGIRPIPFSEYFEEIVDDDAVDEDPHTAYDRAMSII